MQKKFKPSFAFHPSETLKDKLEEMNISMTTFAQKIAIPDPFW
jgi:plasmid maintenance system antidote protein VapI